VPDAKAFTDAPENLTILIKQRRRWMNGALFAAFRVIRNFYNMTNCSKTTHGPIRQLGMLLYMIYFLTMQVLSFFMVGSFYVSIKLFFVNYFKQLTDSPDFAKNDETIYKFFNGSDGIGFSTVFSYGYVSLLVLCILVSLAAPIDRAIEYFKVVAVIFSVFTILSIFGITVFLIGTGFYPPVKQYDPSTETWITLDEPAHFSLLTLSGVIMLSIYIIPVLLRPLDFVFNIP
jgi:chitin synthase